MTRLMKHLGAGSLATALVLIATLYVGVGAAIVTLALAAAFGAAFSASYAQALAIVGGVLAGGFVAGGALLVALVWLLRADA